jgi:ABC-type multidrug transport system permease subunit
VAEALPLKHLIDGLSDAIVGGGSDIGTAVLVVAIWTVVALFLAVRFFKWE